MKFVYDCEFTLVIKGVRDFEDVTGEIKVKEVSNHTLDDDFEVTIGKFFN
jgi:phosphopantetheine adenylyltransferase